MRVSGVRQNSFPLKQVCPGAAGIEVLGDLYGEAPYQGNIVRQVFRGPGLGRCVHGRHIQDNATRLKVLTYRLEGLFHFRYR